MMLDGVLTASYIKHHAGPLHVSRIAYVLLREFSPLPFASDAAREQYLRTASANGTCKRYPRTTQADPHSMGSICRL
ncbi:hypothetical protein, partial [Bifidobacterium jacchi]|uniref:hypothetical protein n=1 Tax=Bifidobacterium jacchi TaxID=2490545 RepID=UPI0019D54D12